MPPLPDNQLPPESAVKVSREGVAILDKLSSLAVLSALPDAAFIANASGIVLAANARAGTIFGAIVGVNIASILRAPEFLSAFQNALRSRQRATARVRLDVPVERHLEIVVSPLDTGTSNFAVCYLVIAFDETEARALDDMRTDFIANASHELRTPLASLKGFIETLQGPARSDPVARERFLGIMSEEAQRMARLIDDLLSLSRVEMHEHVPPTETVDLAAIVEATVNASRPLAEQARQRLDLQRPREPVHVLGDHDQLVQVVSNLLTNAIKYGVEGGWSKVRLEVRGSSVVLEVSDNGIGIAREHLPRLTERFYRVSTKESRARGGTGLGLAIVKHVVLRHGGELAIDSRPGHGSTFTVTIKRV